MLSGIIRNEFTEMGEEATNRMFTAKIRTILNTIYYHLGSFSYSLLWLADRLFDQ